MSSVIVLDKHDKIVSHTGSSVTWLKPCERCSSLVEHLRLPQKGRLTGYAWVPLADHDSQCRP